MGGTFPRMERRERKSPRQKTTTFNSEDGRFFGLLHGQRGRGNHPLPSTQKEKKMRMVKLLEVGEGNVFRTIVTNAEGSVLEHVRSTGDEASVLKFVKVTLLYPDGRRIEKFLHPLVDVDVPE